MIVAPSTAGVSLGLDKGVLSVRVLLHDDVTRGPSAWDAVLNGVNGTIRKQYEHVPLSSVRLPRQLVCSVRGDMSDFTVNIDESGSMFLEDGDSGAWLEARARASNPAGRSISRSATKIGLELLLRETQAASIRGGGM